ncbi:response regulator, partial [Bdellovibrionota bacterium FG-2]
MHKTQHDLVYRRLLVMLKSLRLSTGQSQAAVSEKLGMYSTFMTKVEIGERRLDVLELINLCQIYKVRLVDVLARADVDFEGESEALLQPVPASRTQSETQGDGEGQSQKILIVEDDDLARNELKRILTKEGFQVITAQNGEEGLVKFEQDQPEIIITDLKMAHLDGLQLLRAVKEKSRHTEVILVTGHGDSEEALAALRSGVTCFLKKPINLDVLLLAISRAKENNIQRTHQSAKPTILIIDDEKDISKF